MNQGRNTDFPTGKWANRDRNTDFWGQKLTDLSPKDDNDAEKEYQLVALPSE